MIFGIYALKIAITDGLQIDNSLRVSQSRIVLATHSQKYSNEIQYVTDFS